MNKKENSREFREDKVVYQICLQTKEINSFIQD